MHPLLQFVPELVASGCAPRSGGGRTGEVCSEEQDIAPGASQYCFREHPQARGVLAGGFKGTSPAGSNQKKLATYQGLASRRSTVLCWACGTDQSHTAGSQGVPCLSS